ncbi:MAG: hypothetical protein SGILL_006060 [Bacillariaceae sp.]
MFQEIPTYSPHFGDIGRVDHSIVESHGSIGAYNIEEVLGRGYYGSVRRAVKRDTNEHFAIKIIQKEKVNRADFPSLAVECRALLRFPHPNIIRAKEVIHASENIYIVTEIAARDLFSYYKECNLNDITAKELALGLLLPLAHLHNHGICHLDLKPENVLLTTTARDFTHADVRLADFGLARMAPRSGETPDVIVDGVCCGTRGFFAPEMSLRRDEYVGQHADMWSLGALLLENPFGFQKEWHRSYAQAEYDPEFFHDGLQMCLDELTADRFPGALGDMVEFLHCLLKVNPSERTTASLALRHPWLEEVVQPEVFED